MDSTHSRIAVFRDLVSSVCKASLTIYDGDFQVISSNSPYLNLFHLFFTLDRPAPVAVAEAKEEEVETNRPAVFTNSLGMSWISEACYDKNLRLDRIYLLGPVFPDAYSLRRIEKELDLANISLPIKHHFLDIIKELPVMPLNRFYEYGIMMHCAITGEKMAVSDFLYPNSAPDVPEEELEHKKSSGAYLVEQQILKLVEEGNLGYKTLKQELTFANQLGKLADADYVRQAKNTVIIFCTQCASAAVRGGVSPEIAYYLREEYIRMVEAAPNLAKINEINHNMLEDFVRRVHRVKVSDGISPQIKQSCDYISLHLDEKLDIHMLASRLGYTDYYFSNKFKKEVGISVKDYIMRNKIEKARQMLRTSNMEIQDISDALGYGSQSYFGEIFRRETGMTAGEYRAMERK